MRRAIRTKYRRKSSTSRTSPCLDPSANRHPRNADGPFYVANGECMACGAPENEASTLMSHDDVSGHCFFSHQPANQEETDSAIRALWASCCGAVRYGGDDESVLVRLHQIGMSSCCDNSPAQIPASERRTSGLFRYQAPNGQPAEVHALAESLARGFYGDCSDFKFSAGNVSFRCEWGITGDRSSIRLNLQLRPDGKWLLRFTENEPAQLGFAISAERVLRRMPGVFEVEWFTNDQIRDGQIAGKPHPD